MAYYVPTGINFEAYDERTYGSYTLLFPQLTRAKLNEICAELRSNRRKYLSQLKTDDIILIIDQAILRRPGIPFAYAG